MSVQIPRNKTLFMKARELRKKGRSYSEINKELRIPKSTLSSWFSKRSWSQSVRSALSRNWKKKNANRLIKINKSRKKQTLARHGQFREEARQEFQILKKNPLFLVGLSIYWGEGEKAPRGRVGVINTDLGLLKIATKFFRECLGTPKHKLRGALFIYKDHNPTKMLDFWSKELEIPKSQFIKTQILPSRSNLAKKKTSYGICSTYFSNTKMYIKIMEWLKLLAEDMRE